MTQPFVSELCNTCEKTIRDWSDCEECSGVCSPPDSFICMICVPDTIKCSAENCTNLICKNCIEEIPHLLNHRLDCEKCGKIYCQVCSWDSIRNCDLCDHDYCTSCDDSAYDINKIMCRFCEKNPVSNHAINRSSHICKYCYDVDNPENEVLVESPYAIYSFEVDQHRSINETLTCPNCFVLFENDRGLVSAWNNMDNFIEKINRFNRGR